MKILAKLSKKARKWWQIYWKEGEEGNSLNLIMKFKVIAHNDQIKLIKQKWNANNTDSDTNFISKLISKLLHFKSWDNDEESCGGMAEK